MAAQAEAITLFDTVNDDNLIQCLKFLSPAHAEASRRVCRRFHVASSSDAVWRPLAAWRWKHRRLEKQWLAVASTLPPGSWRSSLIEAEALIHTKAIPAFAMAGRLELGERYDLHFFEPRYRFLVRLAVENHGSKFVFCTRGAPAAGETAWLCEARDVTIMPDGRANLSAVPVARLKIEKAWYEPVPGEPQAPELAMADIEELPFDEEQLAESDEEEEEEDFDDLEHMEHQELLRLFLSQPLPAETRQGVLEILLGRAAAHAGGEYDDDDEDDEDEEEEEDEEGDDEGAISSVG